MTYVFSEQTVGKATFRTLAAQVKSFVIYKESTRNIRTLALSAGCVPPTRPSGSRLLYDTEHSEYESSGGVSRGLRPGSERETITQDIDKRTKQFTLIRQGVLVDILYLHTMYNNL